MRLRLLRLATLALVMAAAVTAAVRPAAAGAATRLRVGYIPIMPMAQLFVMQHEGWVKREGLRFKLTRFSSGPAMVQALASNKLDVAFIGIGPAMVARARGVPIKVVATDVVSQIALIARGDLARDLKRHPGAAGIAAFTKTHHRKPRIATLPKGSVPDTALRYWLEKQLGVDASKVNIKGMGASAVQQALLSGAVDAASIMEPILTIVKNRVPSAAVIARGNDMLPNLPGAVLVVRQGLIDQHPDVVRKLVAMQVRATKMLNRKPQQAAGDVHAFVGRGLLPQSLLAKALTSPNTVFTADPHRIIQATGVMNAFQVKQGLTKHRVDLGRLFDTHIYDSVTHS